MRPHCPPPQDDPGTTPSFAELLRRSLLAASCTRAWVEASRTWALVRRSRVPTSLPRCVLAARGTWVLVHAHMLSWILAATGCPGVCVCVATARASGLGSGVCHSCALTRASFDTCPLAPQAADGQRGGGGCGRSCLVAAGKGAGWVAGP